MGLYKTFKREYKTFVQSIKILNLKENMKSNST